MTEFLYRISRTSPGRSTDVRYGTAKRAQAIAREVQKVNASLEHSAEWMRAHGLAPDYIPVLYTLTVERIPAGEWEDVTAEFA